MAFIKSSSPSTELQTFSKGQIYSIFTRPLTTARGGQNSVITGGQFSVVICTLIVLTEI
jgi:hypothetical protein